jgi:hypothetical protein
MLCENNDVDECLYNWFLQKCSEGIHGVILKRQAVSFNKLLGRVETFRA